MHLKPHNRNLKILIDEKCYNAVVNDKEHTLFLTVPSPQTETEKEAEHAMLWIPHSGKAFSWDEPPKAGPQKIWTNEIAVEDFNKHIDSLPQRVRQVLVRRRA